MSVLDNFPHTCRHQRNSQTQNADMARVDTAVTVDTAIPCFVQNASFDEIQEFQKQDQRITHKVYWRTYSEKRNGDLLNTFARVDGTSANGLPSELTIRATTDRTVHRAYAFCSYCEEVRNVRPSSHT